jgi:hypothetical protein
LSGDSGFLVFGFLIDFFVLFFFFHLALAALSDCGPFGLRLVWGWTLGRGPPGARCVFLIYSFLRGFFCFCCFLT